VPRSLIISALLYYRIVQLGWGREEGGSLKTMLSENGGAINLTLVREYRVY